MVSTLDSESSGLSSNLSGTSSFWLPGGFPQHAYTFPAWLWGPLFNALFPALGSQPWDGHQCPCSCPVPTTPRQLF